MRESPIIGHEVVWYIPWIHRGAHQDRHLRQGSIRHQRLDRMQLRQNDILMPRPVQVLELLPAGFWRTMVRLLQPQSHLTK